MTINRRGASRTVFLVGRWAIKVPTPRVAWRHFLLGWLGNLNELGWWRGGRDPRLCPVVASFVGGLVIVMQRATPICSRRGCPDDAHDLPRWNDLPCERKLDSFGYVDGRIVAVDYGGWWRDGTAHAEAAA